MEFIPGSSLALILKNGNILPAKIALVILRQLIDALNAVHSSGFVHRDLTPENVILVKNDINSIKRIIAKMNQDNDNISDIEIKLIDFNTCTPINYDGFVDAKIHGKPLYFPPEVWENNLYYPESDVYQLGILIYEVLVGEPPFFDTNIRKIKELHLSKKPDLDRIKSIHNEERHNLIDKIVQIVGKMLDKNFHNRPSLKEIDNFLYSGSIISSSSVTRLLQINAAKT